MNATTARRGLAAATLAGLALGSAAVAAGPDLPELPVDCKIVWERPVTHPVPGVPQAPETPTILCYG
jgi:hypothetical protein